MDVAERDCGLATSVSVARLCVDQRSELLGFANRTSNRFLVRINSVSGQIMKSLKGMLRTMPIVM